MTTTTPPTTPAQDANPQPLPWRRMTWVTWRQHRLALGGAVVLLGVVAAYLWLTGVPMHHAHAIVAACRPADSYTCQNQIINFDSSYGGTANTIATLLQILPALIGAFVGAPILARELETGTFRYAWTLGFGRRRWTLAKLVPLAAAVTAGAAAFSQLFTWYYRPFLADGSSIPLDPKLFELRGIALAAWALAGFAIGALAGLLIRRVVPAIAATLAAYTGLAAATGLYMRQHYMAPLLAANLTNSPTTTWILRTWWTKGGTTVSQSTLNQVSYSMFQRFMATNVPPNVNSDNIKFYKSAATAQVQHDLIQQGYTHWTSYQPGSRFWPFQWIEGGWLLALSALLITTTVWLVGHRPS